MRLHTMIGVMLCAIMFCLVVFTTCRIRERSSEITSYSLVEGKQKILFRSR